jgi:hypothetical protein
MQPSLASRRSPLLLLAVLVTLSLVSFTEACSSLKTNAPGNGIATEEGYAMGRGMSGGVAAPEVDMFAQGEMMDMAAPPSEAASAGRDAGVPVSAPQLNPDDFLKQQVDIESWFSPKAYAAENTPDEEYLIRTGDMTLTVLDYDDTAKKIEVVGAKYGAIVTDSSGQQQWDGNRNGYLRLRVPSEEFRKCFDELKTLGDVTSENIASQDVSQSYVTAISRLKALLTEQETLRNMLTEAREIQRTRGLGEAYSVLLQTQQRLSEVTAQVQAIEDQVSQLADQITRSTITVNLNQVAQLPQGGKYNPGYSETWQRAKRDFILGRDQFINGLIYFVGSFWGLFWLLVIGGAAWWAWSRIKRALRKSKSKPSPAA